VKRSTQKQMWLAKARGLVAAFKKAQFVNKPAHVWEVVCERVSGGYMFTARAVEKKPKARKKKAESAS